MRLRKMLGTAIAAAAVAAPFSANAAISAGTDSPPLAELFLTVWDVSTGNTYAQDLGINANIESNLSQTFSVNVNSTTFNNLFGSASNTNLRWGVYASLADVANFPTSGGEFIAFTAPVGTNTSTWLTANPGDVDQNSQNIQGLANGQNQTAANPTNYTLNNITTATSGAGSVGNNLGNLFNGQLSDTTGRVTFGAIGQALTLFKIGFDNQSTGDLNVRNTYLNFAFDGATLAYGAVPLPAGLWLLGSALLGLVGISRRKTLQPV